VSDSGSLEESQSDLIWDDEDETKTFSMSGSHTVVDYKAGMRLTSSKFTRYFGGCFIVLAVFACVYVFLSTMSGPESEPVDHLTRGISILLIVVLVMPHLVNNSQLRKMADQQLGVFAPTHTLFDSSKLTTTLEGGKIEYEWSAFSQVLANDRVALLVFKNSAPPLLLSRTKLQPPTAWEEFLDFLHAQVPEPS
jgi:hypothetical protein